MMGDFKFCEDRGCVFEDFAASTLRQNGHFVRKASDYENRVKHIDFWAQGFDKKEYSFDAKAMRSLFRGGPLQDEWVVIEWKNVFGNKGSVFGEQDFFVFERFKSLDIVRRSDLEFFGRREVNFAKRARSASEAKYCVYTRDGRNDLISLVRLDDIEISKRRVLSVGKI